MFFLGVLSAIAAALIVNGVYNLQGWKVRMSETFGEKFTAMAEGYDAEADQWERELLNGFAGWDCGRQADGLYRSMALTLIEHNRAFAKAIRAELPGGVGYGESKYDFEHSEERQQRWQSWYDDFQWRIKKD